MSVYTREELITSLYAALDGAALAQVERLILSPRECMAIVDWAVSHGVQIREPRIERGDVLAWPEDAAKYEIPAGTAFRDRDGYVLGFTPVNADDYMRRGPYRCIDVPGDDSE